MKLRTLIAFLVFGAALAACSKPNDVATLREDASAIAKYNAPTLELYAKRGDAALTRIHNLPTSQPGYADAMRALEDGRQKFGELKGIEASLEKQAEKETSVANLEKLVEENEAKYEENLTIIHDDLSAAEAWIARTEDALAHGQAAPAPAPAAPPETEPAPAAPEPPKAEPKKEPAKGAPAEPKKEPAKTEAKTPEPKKAPEPAKKPAEPTKKPAEPTKKPAEAKPAEPKKP